jgi:NAD dependent epimerase/dehydratase family enzyme
VLTRDVRGPVNAVGPNPVSNREFGKALGRALRRPAIAPLPALAVRAFFGEMGETLILQGARVLPGALQRAGFEWQLPDLDAALRFELGRMA